MGLRCRMLGFFIGMLGCVEWLVLYPVDTLDWDGACVILLMPLGRGGS